jgi:hypothetical protein
MLMTNSVYPSKEPNREIRYWRKADWKRAARRNYGRQLRRGWDRYVAFVDFIPQSDRLGIRPPRTLAIFPINDSFAAPRASTHCCGYIGHRLRRAAGSVGATCPLTRQGTEGARVLWNGSFGVSARWAAGGELGKIRTTSVRRLISSFRRSSRFVDWQLGS